MKVKWKVGSTEIHSVMTRFCLETRRFFKNSLSSLIKIFLSSNRYDLAEIKVDLSLCQIPPRPDATVVYIAKKSMPSFITVICCFLGDHLEVCFIRL